jgi:hypothetical protein
MVRDARRPWPARWLRAWRRHTRWPGPPTLVSVRTNASLQALAQGPLHLDPTGCLRVGEGGPFIIWPHDSGVSRTADCRVQMTRKPAPCPRAGLGLESDTSRTSASAAAECLLLAHFGSRRFDLARAGRVPTEVLGRLASNCRLSAIDARRGSASRPEPRRASR